MATTHPDRAQRIAVWAVTALGVLFVVGLAATGGTGLGLAYAPLCHQMPERSLTFGGAPMAVCSRCTGLYLGGAIGLAAGAALGAWRRRVPSWWFFAAVAPTVLTFTGKYLGFPGLANVPRLIVAIPAGVACGWFLAVGIGDWLSTRRETRERAAAAHG